MGIDCKLCSERDDKIPQLILQTNNWIVFAGPYQSNLQGYLIMEPVRHLENWSDFTTDELSQMGQLISEIESRLADIMEIERLYVVVISEVVRHVHLHLIPRVKEQAMRGVPLIIQATQQVVDSITYSEEDYLSWISILRAKLNIQ